MYSLQQPIPTVESSTLLSDGSPIILSFYCMYSKESLKSKLSKLQASRIWKHQLNYIENDSLSLLTSVSLNNHVSKYSYILLLEHIITIINTHFLVLKFQTNLGWSGRWSFVGFAYLEVSLEADSFQSQEFSRYIKGEWDRVEKG